MPGDKSISHRVLLMSALAEGVSELRGLSTGQDVMHTALAMAAFGAGVERVDANRWKVTGGLGRLHEPEGVIDVGNSGTGMRLLAGWAAGREGLAVLAGDESVTQRPMGRVVRPLEAMGAQIDGRRGATYPPLVVRGGDLQGIDHAPEVASAQVKGALLLAGLAASGVTTVREEVATRAHTEELLTLFGAEVSSAPGMVSVRRSELSPAQVEVPGDPSQAAFWVVAACIVPGSDLVVERVYVGPARAGFLGVLERMGADVSLESFDPGSRTADIRARHSQLHSTRVEGDEVPSLIDEVPVLAVAAAYAAGETVFADASELKVKETDRTLTVSSELTALGGQAQARPDGLSVLGGGGRPLRGGSVLSHGDHRVAMAMAIAGLAAVGPVRIEGWESVATSYPDFDSHLADLGSGRLGSGRPTETLRVEEAP